jgi:hypothetical protein
MANQTFEGLHQVGKYRGLDARISAGLTGQLVGRIGRIGHEIINKRHQMATDGISRMRGRQMLFMVYSTSVLPVNGRL